MASNSQKEAKGAGDLISAQSGPEAGMICGEYAGRRVHRATPKVKKMPLRCSDILFLRKDAKGGVIKNKGPKRTEKHKVIDVFRIRRHGRSSSRMSYALMKFPATFSAFSRP